MYTKDTIAAISTPAGEGAVGIIRVSGPDALNAAFEIFRTPGEKKDLRERYLYYGNIEDGGAVLDSACMVFMRGPRSYTGEDTVELHCHGGTLVLKKVLEAILRRNARIAGPGEFTKRAYLNGKLDLAQAEAVIDIIRAQTETALSSAQARLGGTLSKTVYEVRNTLLDLLMHLEAELDFPEDEIDPLPKDEIETGLSKAEGSLRKLLSTYEEGRVLREGVKVLILGRPNVGKSSLLNILLKEERAIVTPVPGTTRDVIEEVINLRGIPVRLMDTAGLRETSDHVEAIGVRAAKEKIRGAQLILYVVDASAPDYAEDTEQIRCAEGKRVIVVHNKADLSFNLELAAAAFNGYNIRPVSALTSDGIEELKDDIYAEATGRSYGAALESAPGGMIASLRHKESIEKSLHGIIRTRAAVGEGLPREFIATDLRWALDMLGEITGETTTEDILDKIFSSFCIGK